MLLQSSDSQVSGLLRLSDGPRSFGHWTWDVQSSLLLPSCNAQHSKSPLTGTLEITVNAPFRHCVADDPETDNTISLRGTFFPMQAHCIFQLSTRLCVQGRCIICYPDPDCRQGQLQFKVVSTRLRAFSGLSYTTYTTSHHVTCTLRRQVQKKEGYHRAQDQRRNQ